MKRWLIIILLLVAVSCSKEDDPNLTETSPSSSFVCIPAPTLVFTLNDEMTGNEPKDSIIWSTNLVLIYQAVMTPNGDGYNDNLRIQTTPAPPAFMPDSSFLIVKDGCGNIYYDSRYWITGLLIPPAKLPSWNGEIHPDSISWHQPIVEAIEGRYIYQFDIYGGGGLLFQQLAMVELTRP